MSIIEIFLLILIIVGIILGIYFIISLKNINTILDIVQGDISKLSDKLEPILDNLKVITEKAVDISDETEKRVLDISNTIQNVRNTVSKLSFSGKGNSTRRSPIQDLLGNLTAASRGISTFWSKLNN